jgi:glucose 1-dehydrogenase
LNVLASEPRVKHQGKVVLGTGVALGLGQAGAERFHAGGANVVPADMQADKSKVP